MYRLLAKPKWIGFHLLCIAAIVAMINLAFWQLGRLDQRQTLNDRVAANSAAAIVGLDDLDLTELDAVAYRQVEVSGTYVASPQLQIVNLSQGGVSGTDPVNALQLADGSVILINRGFLAHGAALAPPPAGEVQIVGRLRAGHSGGADSTPDAEQPNLIHIRRINTMDIGELLQKPVAPMYLELVASLPADSPALEPIPLPEASNGPHLSYAVQWFIFSAAVLVGWVFAVRKSVRRA